MEEKQFEKNLESLIRETEEVKASGFPAESISKIKMI